MLKVKIVRLGATRDLLDRAGFRPVDRHEIVKEKSVEKLNVQFFSYYCTVKLHVSDSALPPLVSKATTFQ